MVGGHVLALIQVGQECPVPPASWDYRRPLLPGSLTADGAREHPCAGPAPSLPGTAAASTALKKGTLFRFL